VAERPPGAQTAIHLRAQLGEIAGATRSDPAHLTLDVLVRSTARAIPRNSSTAKPAISASTEASALTRHLCVAPLEESRQKAARVLHLVHRRHTLEVRCR
jgi:hypothetical protein